MNGLCSASTPVVGYGTVTPDGAGFARVRGEAGGGEAGGGEAEDGEAVLAGASGNGAGSVVATDEACRQPTANSSRPATPMRLMALSSPRPCRGPRPFPATDTSLFIV